MDRKILKTAAVGAAAFAVALAAVTAAAVSDSKTLKTRENEFKPANIGIAVRENDDSNTSPTPEPAALKWTESGEMYTAEKKVQIYNRTEADGDYSISNPTEAFIRVCFLPRWVTDVNGTETDVTNIEGIKASGEFPSEITGYSFALGDVTFTLAEDWAQGWIYGGKGYFYCKKPVSPGESTPLLLQSVSITKETQQAAESLGVTLHIDVLADSIQTEGQDEGETTALYARWGTPDTLGIEISGGELREYTTEGGNP